MDVPPEYQWLVPVLSTVAIIIAAVLGRVFRWGDDTSSKDTSISGAAIVDSSAIRELVTAQNRTAKALERIVEIMLKRDEHALHEREMDALKREIADLKRKR